MRPCSALPHGVGGMESGADADTGSGVFGVRAQIRRAFVAPCGCFAAKLRSDPKNQVARAFVKYFWTQAQVIRAQAAIESIANVRPEPVPESDSGPPPQNPCECAEERSFRRIRARACLSAASLHETPAEASTGGCPQRSGGTQTPGSPFFSLGFFGEAKKSKSPAAATERHRNVSKQPRFRSDKGFDTPCVPCPEPVEGSARTVKEDEATASSARSFDTSGRTGETKQGVGRPPQEVKK